MRNALSIFIITIRSLFMQRSSSKKIPAYLQALSANRSRCKKWPTRHFKQLARYLKYLIRHLNHLYKSRNNTIYAIIPISLIKQYRQCAYQNNIDYERILRSHDPPKCKCMTGAICLLSSLITKVLRPPI